MPTLPQATAACIAVSRCRGLGTTTTGLGLELATTAGLSPGWSAAGDAVTLKAGGGDLGNATLSTILAVVFTFLVSVASVLPTWLACYVDDASARTAGRIPLAF